jgi:hypothetical protein
MITRIEIQVENLEITLKTNQKMQVKALSHHRVDCIR